MKLKRFILASVFLFTSSVLTIQCDGAEISSVPKLRPEYFDPPSSRTADVCQDQAKASGVRAFFYDGPQYKGQRTRVFAFYGAPANATPQKRVPGIVLVHGGGGTAFETWVKLWVDRGYAAIAMDTCGCVPIGTDPKGGKFSNKWQRLPDGGPPGWGGLDQMKDDPEDNWMHQATAAVVLGHSWLRAQPEVDPNRIGITGVSWGGVLTCRAAGADSRFAFAVPVYGCGFLHESSVWMPVLQQAGEQGRLWAERYDPSHLLSLARMPFLWLNGSNDFAFPLDSWRKSARTTPGTSRVCSPLRMPHGHGGAGENPDEILVFADSIVRRGESLLLPASPTRTNGRVQTSWEGKIQLAKAELIFTRDTTSPWKDRLWDIQEAAIDLTTLTISTPLPTGSRLWYLHLTDKRGVSVSTEYVEEK